MQFEKRYVAYASIVLGLLLTMGLATVLGDVGSEDVRVLLSVCAGIAIFGGFWYGNYDTLSNRPADGSTEIYLMAGWNAAWAFFLVLGTSIVVFRTTTVTVSLSEADMYLLLAGVVTYGVSVLWYSRRAETATVSES